MNHTISKTEMQAAREQGLRTIILHTEPNRSERRGKKEESDTRPVINNRSHPKERRKVYEKMGYFAIVVGAQMRGMSAVGVKRRMRAKHERVPAGD